MKQLRHSRPDYILIGAGTSGCILANRLSKYNVTLIEAGSDDRGVSDYWKVRMPGGNSLSTWGYHTEVQNKLENRSLAIPRGKIVGGTTSINDMTYTRGNPSDYQEWGSSWTYRDCLPYFKKAECYELGENEYRGFHGPLKVTRSKTNDRLADAFINAGIERGYKYTVDMNGYRQEGIGPMDKMIYKGQRWNTSSAYLQVVRHLIDLRTETLAHKLLIEGDKCIGVEIERKGIKEILYAEKEVIICAGAIQSPHLLMLSGIGKNLEYGIKTIRELPVGENLQDQLQFNLQCSYETKLKLKQQLLEPLQGLFTSLEWLLFNEGRYASNQIDFGGFIKSHSSNLQPDMQLQLVDGITDQNRNLIFQKDAFQLSCRSLRMRSKGFLKLRSNHAKDHLIIQPNYLQESKDFEDLIQQVKLSIEYLKAQSFDKLSRKFGNIDPGYTDTQIEDWIRQNAQSAYHPVGTCSMGKVTDESGKVIGIENLRVVDASIIPVISSANTSASIIMMAEKIADDIKGVKIQSADIPYYI